MVTDPYIKADNCIAGQETPFFCQSQLFGFLFTSSKLGSTMRRMNPILTFTSLLISRFNVIFPAKAMLLSAF